MKKIIALILAFACVLPLAACSGEEKATQSSTVEATVSTKEGAAPTEESENSEEKTDKETDKEYNMTVVDPISTADLEAIPIATSGMTTDELRSICVRFFKLSVSFPFKPDREYNYTIVNHNNQKMVLEKGKLYGGIPYISVGGGNLYRVMDFYNSETGELNLAPFRTDPKVFGNACSGAASWAWSRVINSVTFQWTSGMVHSKGYLKVGPYEYDTSILAFGDEWGLTHSDVKNANGEQKMFESYALVLPADGVVNPDHVRMVSASPVVVRKSDGTIDGKKSYVTCTEQTGNRSDIRKFQRTQSDGTPYENFGVESWDYTFEELYKGSYLPFTFKEFLGEDPVEPATVSIVGAGESVSPEALRTFTLKANYVISDVYFSVKDAEGKEVFLYVRRGNTFRKYEMEMDEMVPADALKKYVDGSYTIEISCRLGNGEMKIAYTGGLVTA